MRFSLIQQSQNKVIAMIIVKSSQGWKYEP